MAPSSEECVQNMDISFDMERLFDHYNFDHIPPENRLSQFKQRDLAHVKYYKTAVKIFGGPSKRTRVHIAPPMETVFKHRLGVYQNEFKPPHALSVNRQLKPSQVRLQTEETITGKEAEEEEKEYVTHYNKLIAVRKQLCNDLDNLLPNEAYLARKINKSEMEKRVQAQYRAQRVKKPEVSLPVEKLPTPKPHQGIPNVALPPEGGIPILDTFLSRNKLRLMDLFHIADKNKNLSLTRQEILNAVTRTAFPLTEADVDTMFVMLDTDLDGKLSYQELNKGLQLWHKQKRFTVSQSNKKAKKLISIKNTSEGNKIRPTSSGAETASKPALKAQSKGVKDYDPASNQQRQDTGDSRRDTEMYYKEAAYFSSAFEKDTVPSHEVNTHEVEDLHDSTKSHLKSMQRISDKTHLVCNGKETPGNEGRPGSHRSSSHSRTSTPSSLELPPPDLRQEARTPSSLEEEVDIRKHDRVVLSRSKIRRQLTPDKQMVFDEPPGVIKVGYKPIDDHCLGSTMGGQTADVVSQFRQATLKEYFSIQKLFEQRGLPFTQKVLDRVILYPGDQPVNELKGTNHLPVGQLTGKKHPFTKIESIGGDESYLKLGTLDNSSIFAGDKFSHVKRNIDNASDSIDNESSQRKILEHGQEQTQIKNGQGFLTIQDIYPSGSSVTTKGHKENLHPGKALISREAENRMTFGVSKKYTQHPSKRFPHTHNKNKSQSTRPSYLSNKRRLYIDSDLAPVNGHRQPLESRSHYDHDGYVTGIYKDTGNALFQLTAQPKRAYPGYNNDLLTWPVGENGVRYGNIDEHRLVK